MPVAREARYLSGVDRGKHVTLTVPGTRYTMPWELAGTLTSVQHWGDGTVTVLVLREDGPARGTGLPSDTQVTITGKESHGKSD